MATWSVQGCRGKTQEIIKEMEQLRTEIESITETKKKSTGSEVCGNYLHFYSGVPKENRAKRESLYCCTKSGDIILLTGNVLMNEL